MPDPEYQQTFEQSLRPYQPFTYDPTSSPVYRQFQAGMERRKALAEKAKVLASNEPALWSAPPETAGDVVGSFLIPFENQLSGLAPWRSENTLMEGIGLYAGGKFANEVLPPVARAIQREAPNMFRAGKSVLKSERGEIKIEPMTSKKGAGKPTGTIPERPEGGDIIKRTYPGLAYNDVKTIGPDVKGFKKKLGDYGISISSTQQITPEIEEIAYIDTKGIKKYAYVRARFALEDLYEDSVISVKRIDPNQIDQVFNEARKAQEELYKREPYAYPEKQISELNEDPADRIKRIKKELDESLPNPSPPATSAGGVPTGSPTRRPK